MKYPIVVNIKQNSMVEEIFLGHSTKSLRNQEQLFLFTRSNRDKEAWTKWLIKASRTDNFPSSEEAPILAIRAGRPLAEPRPVYIERRTKSVWLNKLVECIFSQDTTKRLIKSMLNKEAETLLRDMREQGYFNPMLRVSVDNVDLSSMSVPRVIGVAPRYENEYGLWEEVNVRYSGIVSVTLRIELNVQEMQEADIESFWFDQLQHLAHYPFFKRILENTAIFVVISLDSVRGVLALNIPHPPTDTAWIGFRSNTRISVTGKVYWGTLPVPFFHNIIASMTNYMTQSFYRHFLVPNMMQICLPPFFNQI
ncbi:uncharacterized protein LOC135939368 [Cloeon dipterum]|uniref:uncharacterized protein LOC135939368 n=1 Tax=Cloeon dipterum TaxID=197152 RepID=UPI0032209419